MNKIRNIFLNEKIVFTIIILNSLIIFLQESGIENVVINGIDIVCILFFFIEMLIKQCDKGIVAYWKNGWDRFDGLLVLIALPSLISYFMPTEMYNFSRLLVLRMFRIFRFFRIFHLFPDFTTTMRNIRLALKQSFSVLTAFLVLLIVVSIINSSIFSRYAPEYFSTPLDAIYSTFRLCTVEGWYEIPDAITANLSHGWAHIVRLYFSLLLFAGGIIGLSIVNSIFVDAMVSDNNDEVLSKIEKLQESIDEIQKQLSSKDHE